MLHVYTKSMENRKASELAFKYNPHKQQFSNPGVLNISIPIVKIWKLTYAVQYFNIFEMYNSIYVSIFCHTKIELTVK